MTDYAFTTIWHIAALVAPVWIAIIAVERWPQWWCEVEAVVRLLTPGAQGWAEAIA